MFLHLYNAEQLDLDPVLNDLFQLQSDIKSNILNFNGPIRVYTITDSINKYSIASAMIWQKRADNKFFATWSTFDDFNTFYYSGGWENLFQKYFIGCIPI